MTGSRNGLATLLKRDYPLLFTIHCQAHRLELAVNNAVDSVRSISHLRSFVDSLYSLYSRSAKNQYELEAVSQEVGIQLLRVSKIFDVRWVFSTYTAIRALWRNYPALYKHFSEQASSADRSGAEKAKFNGLAKKMATYTFISEIGLLKDLLRELKTLSLFFQSRSANITEAYARIRLTMVSVQSLKNTDGKSLGKYHSKVRVEKSFKGVSITCSDAQIKEFEQHRLQFCQAIDDNLNYRFEEAVDAVKMCEVLDERSWPRDEEERVAYGQNQVRKLAKSLRMDANLVLLEFGLWKAGRPKGDSLSAFLKALDCLPISTAECERGFSDMNLARTKIRNALTISRVSSLLFIKINGAPLQFVDFAKYVQLWLRSGHRSATSQNRVHQKKTVGIENKHTVFM